MCGNVKKTIIEIDKEPYYKGEEVFKTDTFTFSPGQITVLVGPNGAGKSTLLSSIKRYLRSSDIPFVSYDNVIASKESQSQSIYSEDYETLSALWEASEGQSIVVNLNNFSKKIGNAMRVKAADSDQFWILMDATDSGLSINNIINIKELLFKTVLENNDGKDIYIVVAANSYEYTVPIKGLSLECMGAKTGEKVSFDSYEDYRHWICNYEYVIK